MYKRPMRGWAKHWDFILLDTICLQISFVLAFYIRFNSLNLYSSDNTYRTSGFVLMLLSVVIAIFFNTMHNVLHRGLWEEIKNTIVQCGLVFVCIIVLLFTDKASTHVSRIVFYTSLILYLVLSFTTRQIYKKILISHKKNINRRELLLVGDEEGVRRALAAFEDRPEEGINVKGIVMIESLLDEVNGIPVVANEKDACHYIRNEWIDEVYVAVFDYSLIPHELISQCSEMAVTVHQQMFIHEDVHGKQLVNKIAKQPVLTTSINSPRPDELIIKRFADIICGLFLSLIAVIVLSFVAPIIKLKSPGPVMLKQERIGRNGKKFKMYVIRTMYMDAEKRFNEWIKKHPSDILTIDNDPRFIGNEDGKPGIGAFLRKCSFDDLPKGFSVLLGSMSLVGIRAPSVEEWDNYEFHHRARLACKPGLTGIWQASGRSKEMSFEEATKLDIEYIANWSLDLDLKILLKTATLRN